jgi:UDP-N-acetylmuramoyl-tripeptide--D-alanyl-D-alanine ligase
VVTTIGAAHLETLRTLEGVVSEKSALVRAVPPSGLVILGDDHEYVSKLEQAAQARVVRVTGKGVDLSKNITRAVCRHMGIPEQITSAVLSDFKSLDARLCRLELPGMTIIDDTYNANPLSMKLGLDTLAAAAKPGRRRLAILGGMAELGEESARHHEEVGAYARSRADVLIGVGNLSREYHPDHWFDTSEACADQIQTLLREGDCLLVKGSASVRMGQIVKKLGTLGPS